MVSAVAWQQNHAKALLDVMQYDVICFIWFPGNTTGYNRLKLLLSGPHKMNRATADKGALSGIFVEC